MNRGHLYRGGGADSDLIDRAHNAATEETRPRAQPKSVRGQFVEDVIHELAALRRPRDGATSGLPADCGYSADHAGKIAACGI